MKKVNFSSSSSWQGIQTAKYTVFITYNFMFILARV